MGDQKKEIQASLSPRAAPGFFCSQHLSVLELRQDQHVALGGRIENIKLLEEQKFDAQEPVLVIKTR